MKFYQSITATRSCVCVGIIDTGEFVLEIWNK